MDIDGLFQLPLAQFTAARNAMATRLKKAGKTADAEAVKALPKPSLPAWAVNQLFWGHRKVFTRLIENGERFRKAQAAQLAGQGADLRATLETQRETLAELTRLAVKILRDSGSNATPEMTRRITTTLEALATYGAHPGAPPAGRLTDDIAPPGFEALAALVPQLGRSKDSEEPTRIIPFTQKARKERTGRRRETPQEETRRLEEERKAAAAAAKRGLAAANRAVQEARKKAGRAEAALKAAAARAKETERAKAAIEKQYERLNAAFEEARQTARKVAGEAEEAAQAVEEAELALEQARRAVRAAQDDE